MLDAMSGISTRGVIFFVLVPHVDALILANLVQRLQKVIKND